MGTKDPRLNTIGKIDFRIKCTISAWEMIDPHTHRVKPIHVQVFWRICFIDKHLLPDSIFLHTVVDIIIITFFFLLRPGKYTSAPSDIAPFWFIDIQLFIGNRNLDIDTCSLAAHKLSFVHSLSLTRKW